MDGGVGLVDLVEEQEARNLLLFELAQDELKLRDFLLVQLADDDRGVDRRQRRAHVVDEFDRARTIDEGVGVAHEIGGGDRKLDAHLVMTRFLAGVTDRVPGLDRALALNRAGAREDRFEQRGLAALERAHQRDAPGTRSSCAVLCHFRLPFAEMRPSLETGYAIVSGRRGIGKRRRRLSHPSTEPADTHRLHGDKNGRPLERPFTRRAMVRRSGPGADAVQRRRRRD